MSGFYDFQSEYGLQFIDGFELGSRAVVSDPCYEYGSQGQVEFDVIPGRWDGFVRTYDDGNGEVTTELVVTNSTSGYVFPDVSIGEFIGVDSGQAGVFDAQYYSDKSHGDNPDFYWDVCDMTVGEGQAGAWDDSCFVSNTGGDGEFQVYADTYDGPASALRIVFVR